VKAIPVYGGREQGHTFSIVIRSGGGESSGAHNQYCSSQQRSETLHLCLLSNPSCPFVLTFIRQRTDGALSAAEIATDENRMRPSRRQDL
jgi:hypothetical protein